MTELAPYIQLGAFAVVLLGFFITISTIIFYGGKIVERQGNESRRTDNHEESLYGENGLVRMVDKHEYHIHHVCERR